MVGSSEVLCSICFEEASQQCQKSVVSLKCSHTFHLDCIGSFFNYRGTMQCPNCRAIENGEWRRPEHHNPRNNVVNYAHNPRNDVVNYPNLERATGNQEQQIEGPPVNGLLGQQPLSEYGTTNYSINFEIGSPMAHVPHNGHHDITHFHHSNIYSSISPPIIGPTTGNSSSMLPSASFGDTFLNSDGFDNQDTITDYPLTLVNHCPPIMDYETIRINWNNAPSDEMLAVPGMGSDADVRTSYPELLVNQDIEIRSEAGSRSHTCQGNPAIHIITFSDDDDDDEIITISDDE